MSRVPHIQQIQGGASLMVAWRLKARHAVVIGGGAVAASRVRRALEADATVTVVAPIISAELRRRWTRGEITWRPRTWLPGDLEGVDMILSCTDDVAQSREIAAIARRARTPINCADIPDLCDFWFTSEHREGPLQIAVSTNGQAPGLGPRLLQHIRDSLPRGAAQAAARFGVLRAAVRQSSPAAAASGKRMSWLTSLARRWSWRDLAAVSEQTIERLVEDFQAGRESTAPETREREEHHAPKVWLVGAGPGDPGLLTQRAVELIEQADLVLADRLVSQAILDRVQGELRVARKFPGQAQRAQDELHQWMLQGVQAGQRVVRLKCGDPLLFGRGGEESDFLAQHGIEAVLVPGVTSALAAPLLASIPTTQRGLADRIVISTARGQHNHIPDSPEFRRDTTFIWLMGVGQLSRLCSDLIRSGFPSNWPAAIVEKASHPEQRSVFAPLSELASTARRENIAAPAIIIVGRVVAAASEAQSLAPARALAG